MILTSSKANWSHYFLLHDRKQLLIQTFLVCRHLSRFPTNYSCKAKTRRRMLRVIKWPVVEQFAEQKQKSWT